MNFLQVSKKSFENYDHANNMEQCCVPLQLSTCRCIIEETREPILRYSFVFTCPLTQIHLIQLIQKQLQIFNIYRNCEVVTNRVRWRKFSLHLSDSPLLLQLLITFITRSHMASKLYRQCTNNFRVGESIGSDFKLSTLES